MVFERFVWRLESMHLILFSAVFGKTGVPFDLVRFESFIRNALIKGEHVVSILFDLEKAYTT